MKPRGSLKTTTEPEDFESVGALVLGSRLRWLGDDGPTKGIERIAAFTGVVYGFWFGVEMARFSIKVHRSYRSDTPRTRS